MTAHIKTGLSRWNQSTPGPGFVLTLWGKGALHFGTLAKEINLGPSAPNPFSQVPCGEK